MNERNQFIERISKYLSSKINEENSRRNTFRNVVKKYGDSLAYSYLSNIFPRIDEQLPTGCISPDIPLDLENDDLYKLKQSVNVLLEQNKLEYQIFPVSSINQIDSTEELYMTESYVESQIPSAISDNTLLTNLKKENDELKNQVKMLQSQLEEEISVRETKIVDLSNNIMYNSGERQNLQEQNQKLLSDIKSLKQDVQRLTAEQVVISEKDEEINKLKQENSSLSTKHQELLSLNSTSKLELDNANKKYNDLEQEHKKYQQYLKDCRIQLQVAKLQLEDAEKKKQISKVKHEEERTKLENEITELEGLVKLHKTEADNLTEQLLKSTEGQERTGELLQLFYFVISELTPVIWQMMQDLQANEDKGLTVSLESLMNIENELRERKVPIVRVPEWNNLFTKILLFKPSDDLMKQFKK